MRWCGRAFFPQARIFLKKPFSLSVLGNTVRAIIDEETLR